MSEMVAVGWERGSEGALSGQRGRLLRMAGCIAGLVPPGRCRYGRRRRLEVCRGAQIQDEVKMLAEHRVQR